MHACKKETFWDDLYDGMHLILLSYQQIYAIAHTICNHPVYQLM
jgi:hypothetical protein